MLRGHATPPGATILQLTANRLDSAALWPPAGAAHTTLARCLLLGVLLHLLVLAWLGNVPGGTARRGEGVWGALNITLRGPQTGPAGTEPALPEAYTGPTGTAPQRRYGGAVRSPEQASQPTDAPGAPRLGTWNPDPTARDAGPAPPPGPLPVLDERPPRAAAEPAPMRPEPGAARSVAPAAAPAAEAPAAPDRAAVAAPVAVPAEGPFIVPVAPTPALSAPPAPTMPPAPPAESAAVIAAPAADRSLPTPALALPPAGTAAPSEAGAPALPAPVLRALEPGPASPPLRADAPLERGPVPERPPVPPPPAALPSPPLPLPQALPPLPQAPPPPAAPQALPPVAAVPLPATPPAVAPLPAAEAQLAPIATSRPRPLAPITERVAPLPPVALPSAAAPVPARSLQPVPGPAPAEASGAPDAGAQVGHDVAGAAAAPASAPRLNLDYVRPRGGELSGGRTAGLLPLLPRPPELRDKLAEGIEKSAKPDCRSAYSSMGVLGAVPLAVDAAQGGGCRW